MEHSFDPHTHLFERHLRVYFECQIVQNNHIHVLTQSEGCGWTIVSCNKFIFHQECEETGRSHSRQGDCHRVQVQSSVAGSNIDCDSLKWLPIGFQVSQAPQPLRQVEVGSLVFHRLPETVKFDA